jgi:toxin ParE1/3/4
MKLVFTAAAVHDLRSIRIYTLESWGEEQENAYLDQIWQRFEIIRSNPTRFRIRADLFPGCRLAAEGTHVILFRIGQDALEIVRVLH